METFSDKEWTMVELFLKAGVTPHRVAEAYRIEFEEFKKRVKEKYKCESSILFRSMDIMGQIMIEATQYQRALAGNIPLLIFIGKTRLGQREPDLISSIPPAQSEIDKDHVIMMLKHRVETLKNTLVEHGDQSEAGPKLL